MLAELGRPADQKARVTGRSLGYSNDRSAEYQYDPQSSIARDDGRVVVADARLTIVRRRAGARYSSGRLATTSDAQLILHAYNRWGEAGPGGCWDFAFIIWDGARQRLICARDHDKRVLFYHATPRLVAVASSVRTLRPEIPSLNEEDRRVSRAAPGVEHTFYSDICRCHPRILSAGQRDCGPKYWAPDPARASSCGPTKVCRSLPRNIQ
jgi:asparagine synthetase B (glutamine-hydrolysing)